MENSIFHRLSNILWGLIVTVMVLLAIYVSVGRMLTSNLAVFRTQILTELNHRLPFTVEASKVDGEWHSFTPVIVLSDLRLSVEGSDDAPLELTAGRVGVDVLGSLRSGSLQLTRLVLDGLNMRGELTEEGRFRIRGFEGGGAIGEWFRQFLLNIELVGLRDNRLALTLPSGETRNLDVSLRLERDGSYRRVEARLVSSKGTHISVLAEGVGNPFTPDQFSGDLYLDIQTSDLGGVKQMWANGPPAVWADGALELELWLAWEEGIPSLEARLEGRNLLLANEAGSWEIPLDRVALEARLLERKNRWTLFASDLVVEKDDEVAQFPRLQLDTWGEALRVRASDVSLASVSAITSGMEVVPEAMANVLEILQPRGDLSSLQVSLGSLSTPARDWALEANFRDLAVNSWKGAPGMTSASGYVELDNDGGFVVLDSQQLTMAFPTIYNEPLNYDDFHGTINLDWDKQALNLSSGVIKALGEEGAVNVLFGLNIPLVKNDVGLEMDLLVGLQNAHPVHRVKYVPTTLNEALRQWLNDSIGEGLVEEGAFLWRGALKRSLAPMRTVQLAFNVSDTHVNYHPRWPPVMVADGIILIDDTNVSVWSNRAHLYDSEVKRLSAESWMNGEREIMLAINGSISGPAANGLTVINDSPVSDIVGGAFRDWTLQGALDTRLDLKMNLTNKNLAPVVGVATTWRDVDLRIQPGNLLVEGLSGAFDYSSAAGFSSRKLAGTIWGQPLTAEVQQRPPEPGTVPGAAGVVEVTVASRVDMADLRQWLGLDSLAFASGETPAELRVVVAPGEAPLLTVDSDLTGVSLDLPTPWRKAEAEGARLHLEAPLGGEGIRLSIQMGDDLRMQLHVVDGVLRSGALGVHQEQAELMPGVLHVSGHAPLVEADEWTRFISTYFYTGGEEPAGTDVTPAGETGAVAEGGKPGQALAISIDQMHADQLLIWGQKLSDVLFSLDIQQGRWQLSAVTDWLQGELELPADGSQGTLHLERLDLDGMNQLNLKSASAGEPLDLPDLKVSIDRLEKGELVLGELAFDLGTQGETLSAATITGDLAGLRLSEAQPGELLWHQGEVGQTELRARFEFDDIGKTLQRFGYERIVETEEGAFTLDLRWPDAPQAFSLQQGEGSVSVDIGKGSFLEAPSGASGALRVVSILNLADIVNRLSLSHMFESGIPFFSVEGEIYLHSGVIEVAGMDVKGPSSFSFSGVSNVAEKTLDGELVATLPVANNLPWVAALTASLPIAAGVYVVSKVFQKQVNRLSSAVYKVSGSWNEPEVKFDHIFDDTSQREQAAGQGKAAPAGSTSADQRSVDDAGEAPDPQDPNQFLPGSVIDPNLPAPAEMPLDPQASGRFMPVASDPNLPAPAETSLDTRAPVPFDPGGAVFDPQAPPQSPLP